MVTEEEKKEELENLYEFSQYLQNNEKCLYDHDGNDYLRLSTLDNELDDYELPCMVSFNEEASQLDEYPSPYEFGDNVEYSSEYNRCDYMESVEHHKWLPSFFADMIEEYVMYMRKELGYNG